MDNKFAYQPEDDEGIVVTKGNGTVPEGLPKMDFSYAEESDEDPSLGQLIDQLHRTVFGAGA